VQVQAQSQARASAKCKWAKNVHARKHARTQARSQSVGRAHVTAKRPKGGLLADSCWGIPRQSGTVISGKEGRDQETTQTLCLPCASGRCWVRSTYHSVLKYLGT
jgi:hypothetical protein